MDDILIKYKQKTVSELFDKQVEKLYKSLPYYIENYTKFKLIPYAYSKELVDEINKIFKVLSEQIAKESFPYENRNENFDYFFNSTPLIDREAEFLKKILYYDNLIDKRLIERWMTFYGRQLKKKLISLLNNISKELSGDTCSIILVFYVTLINFFNFIKSEFYHLNLGKVSNDRKDSFFSYFFYFFIELIFDEFCDELKSADLKNELLFDYSSPILFAEIKTCFLSNPFNFWKLSDREYSFFESIKFYDSFNKEIDNLNSILANSDLPKDIILNVYHLNYIRQNIFRFISSTYCSNKFFKSLVQVLYHPSIFFKFYTEKNYRDNIFRFSKEIPDKEVCERIINFREEIENVISSINSIPFETCLNSSIKNYLKFKTQFFFYNKFNELTNVVKDRRKDSSVNLEEEYENGRLYYFTFEKDKLFRKTLEPKSAVIYIDIRDFSKKTFKLKESSIGELLKEKFYDPILHYASNKTISKEILLHNIVGDSIIFSGSIDEIIRLAITIKKDSEDYKNGLEHIIFDEDKKELMSLDLGIFITYGNKPVIFNISSEFGNHNIAVGEIINLASRGAKRDVNAKRRLDYILEFESKIRGQSVELPFNLYILEGYNLFMPPTLETKLLRINKFEDEKRLIFSFFEQLKLELAIDDSAKKIWSKQKFIYNIGIGLTEEAFLAFLQRMRVYSNINRIIINVKQFPEIIQKKYFFKNEEIEFCYVQNRGSGETFLFRKEGDILFKGFDYETVVWELVTKEMPIYNEIIKCIGG